MGFTWEEAEVAALDRHGVWPIVSIWMRDESRFMQRLLSLLYFNYRNLITFVSSGGFKPPSPY